MKKARFTQDFQKKANKTSDKEKLQANP